MGLCPSLRRWQLCSSALGSRHGFVQPAYASPCCRVERRLEDSKTVAAFQFPGLPLDWCVLIYLELLAQLSSRILVICTATFNRLSCCPG